MAKAGIHAGFLIDLGLACISILSVNTNFPFRHACMQLAGIFRIGRYIQGEIPARGKQG
jgi:hypothetical protein